jgi:20S proteasome subunit beta 1
MSIALVNGRSLFYLALALAMSRDGSSGGTIRMAVITEEGVTRHFIPGNRLPTFWEGKDIIGFTPKKYGAEEAIPIDVEA